MHPITGQIIAGTRVRARSLTWDVLEREDLGEQQRLRLRCTDADLLGLEWDMLHPQEDVVPERDTLDPERPGPLAAWRLLHQAALLDQIPGAGTMVAAEPGRIRIEPYQLVPLMRALELPRPRLLLADGVGLGKTIEAGLIAAELIARRRAHRILIVAPAGPLLRQWEQEMRYRFGLPFTVLADSVAVREERRKLEMGGNPFGSTAFVLTSLDFAKQETVLEELERTTWDLAIIDEAHHCVSAANTTSREDTQRRRLAEVVARQSDGLLLLTATPHDGYDPHFASLMELLDPSLVDGNGGLLGMTYRRHVVRRLKSHIADPATGRPLFRDRRVTPIPIVTDDPDVQAFHRALSALVVPRLEKAQDFGDSLAFVSLLKRSVSTIAACVATLRVVADRYAGAMETEAVRRDRIRTLRAFRRRAMRYGVLDSQTETDVEQLEAEDIAAQLRATGDTEAALRTLIQLGEAAAPSDPKLEALVDEVRLIRSTEPRANILIYTEYADSQAAAVRALAGIGGAVLTIAGHDSEEARTRAAERCAMEDNLILVSTDSLAEGLNLQQRCHHLIHLDLPYNPNRLEQRNGRIDRYGQTEDPQIRYLCLAGTFEERLLLRLIAKYEKARAQLTFMPDTLGITADEDRYGTELLSGLAEEHATLFPEDKAPIRTLDVAATEAETAAFSALLHEIDRAYEGFDGMAVRHGWFAGQGLSADAALMRAAVRVRQTATRQAALVDLAEFVSNSMGDDALPEAAGRAHPAVRQAIGRARQAGDGRVSVARYDRHAILLTYSMEIHAPRYVAFQRTIAVLIAEDGKPEVILDPERWLNFGAPAQDRSACDAWPMFRDWAPARLPEAEAAAGKTVHALAVAFAAQHADAVDLDHANLDRWLARRADAICGPRQPAAADLFGASPSGPAWRFAAGPIDRLSAFATDIANAPADRRGADGIVSLYRRRLRHIPTLSPPLLHRIGLLMLIPEA